MSAQYQQTVGQYEQDIERVIIEAQSRPITSDEATFLAWACGISIENRPKRIYEMYDYCAF